MKFYEKGDRPLEIITSRQWFIKTMDFLEAVERARRAQGIPLHAGTLRELDQRPERRLVHQPPAVFGVPFPVWYPARRGRAASTTSHPLLPADDQLPVDLVTDTPPGYRADQRAASGVTGDPDVMDTWATSSLTPQISCGRLAGSTRSLVARTFPFGLRSQAHDIIRT